MRTITRTTLLLATLSLLGAYHGSVQAAAVEVLQVQSPAWLERGGERLPLAAGDQLDAGDRVVSGREARVLLLSGDGGRIKLGADAGFDIDDVAPVNNAGGVFRGLFSVLAGAFRYTTAILDRGVERDLRFRIGAVTAGVRGTDIWGRSTRERDLLCLIEGRVVAGSATGADVELSEPLSLYAVPRGGAAEPVTRVAPDQLSVWAAETEMQPGQGRTSRDGRWRAHLASTGSRVSAAAIRERLREAGYPVELQLVTLAGKRWWRVLLPGLIDAADARAAGARIDRDLGIGRPWISRQQ